MSDKDFLTWEDAVSDLISQPHQQQLVRDCYFDPSVDEAANRYFQSPEWEAVKDILPEDVGHALDLGAGRGIASFALAKLGWKVTAVEPDPSALVGAGAITQLAENHELPISISQEFGEKLNFPDNHFNLVFARQVLHHADDLQKLCKELFRVLKPGGMFVAIREHVITKQADLSKFYDVHPLHHLYGGEYAYTLNRYRAVIKKAGFDLDTVIRPFDSAINYSPYTYNTLRDAIQTRLSGIPLGGLAGRLLNKDAIFKLLLRIFSYIDQRPGRLFSFVCHKPSDNK
jgi:SAM-dependent methyltransferase